MKINSQAISTHELSLPPVSLLKTVANKEIVVGFFSDRGPRPWTPPSLKLDGLSPKELKCVVILWQASFIFCCKAEIFFNFYFSPQFKSFWMFDYLLFSQPGQVLETLHG